MGIHSLNTDHWEDKTPCFKKSLKKILLNWRESVTNAPMPLHLLAWKTWNFLCDFPCSELSKGSSDQGEGSVRAAPRRACKPVLQSWEVVAAGAGRANAAWHWLCSYAGCWWNVRRLTTGKGITEALLELFSGLMQKDEFPCPMAATTAEPWACTARAPGMIPCVFPATCPCRGGNGLVWDNGPTWGRMSVWTPNPLHNNITQ